jgi:GMP synthase (glutamine-hydrolysing)
VSDAARRHRRTTTVPKRLFGRERFSTVMSRLRVALLDASDATHTPRNFRRELDADLVEFDAASGDLPETVEFDAAVVTGSRSSVYDDEAWIDALEAWVRDADERNLPMLGVCYGHQLLASALDGTVEGMGEYEIGYRTVEHRGGRLFDGIDSPFTVFTTHSDAVVELPEEATVTAENDYGIHGFRRGAAFGVQFHPEYDRRTAREVTEGKDLAPERAERVLAGITEANYRRACEAKQLFENFTAYVREHRAGAETPASAADD